MDNPAGTAVPEPLELLPASVWAAEQPGLPEAAEEWLFDLPEARLRIARRARALATPALHPRGIGRLLALAGRAVVGASLWLTVDLFRAVWRAIVHGERERAAELAAYARLEDSVRKTGPAAVKLGQFIATARGLLPEELVEAFAWCRDDVPPVAEHRMWRVVKAELGRPIEEVFEYFEAEPFAAASIAQVHHARLVDGSEVVVKIRRPGLRKAFESELRALALLAAFLEPRYEAVRAANLSGFVDLFAHLVLEELDLRVEATNMVEIGLVSEHAGMDYVRCPRPIPDLVTERLLVMEHLDGVPYTAVREAYGADALDGRRLLRLGIQGVLEHTLVYGVFHGDLHAGNVLVDSGGHFSLVDFGIVGRLDEDERRHMIRFLLAFTVWDVATMVDAAYGLGAVPPGVDVDAAVAELEEVARQRPAEVTHSELVDSLSDAVRALIAHGFRLPPSMVLFFKNLLYLNGLAASLAPDTDLLSQVGPILAHFQTKYPEHIAEAT
ncbi:MAG: AarF/ABC1/UbiB kinase family protein [Acidimicrobiia bacterium]|nr:AarF/ABC1/UbiB kinase family protein [Acidimicrobiia bacterium]